jgi:hypothetical protein
MNSGGYMKIARNKNNICGVSNYVSYPILKIKKSN